MAGRPWKINPERLRDMAAAGMTGKQIAAEFGASVSGAYAAANRCGVDVPGRNPGQCIKKTSHEAVRELAAAGMSQIVIAGIVGVTRERVRQICNAHAIDTLSGNIDWDGRDLAVEMAKNGRTAKEIAASTGRPVSSVQRWLREAGVKAVHSRTDTARLQRLRDLAAAGFSQAEAANELGMHACNVSATAKKHGISFRGGRRAIWAASAEGRQ